MSNFVSYQDATSLFTEVGNKIKALNGAYIFRGSITFDNLPGALLQSMTGYVYNITDEFTTDSRFIEGAGKKYSAGTNVAVANVGSGTTVEMMFDVVSSFVNVDELEGKIATVVADLADEFNATSGTYEVGDVVTHNGELYKFKTAHSVPGDWDSTEVDAVTVEALIQAAEPSSLTTEQINALIALL